MPGTTARSCVAEECSNGTGLPARVSVITPVASGITFQITAINTTTISPRMIGQVYRRKYGIKPLKSSLGGAAFTVSFAELLTEVATLRSKVRATRSKIVHKICRVTGSAWFSDSSEFQSAAHARLPCLLRWPGLRQPGDHVLLKLQAPSGDRLNRRHAQIAFGIFQVFIAPKKFLPFAVIIFGNHRAGDNRSGNAVFRRFRHHVGYQHLLFASLRQIAVYQHLAVRSAALQPRTEFPRHRRFRGLCNHQIVRFGAGSLPQPIDSTELISTNKGACSRNSAQGSIILPDEHAVAL